MPQIQLKPVNSSRILAVGFDPTRNRLYLEFKVKTGRSVYEYSHVNPEVAASILFAPSIGKAFGAILNTTDGKRKYPFLRLAPAELADLVTTAAPAWLPVVEDARS